MRTVTYKVEGDSGFVCVRREKKVGDTWVEMSSSNPSVAGGPPSVKGEKNTKEPKPASGEEVLAPDERLIIEGEGEAVAFYNKEQMTTELVQKGVLEEAVEEGGGEAEPPLTSKAKVEPSKPFAPPSSAAASKSEAKPEVESKPKK